MFAHNDYFYLLVFILKVSADGGASCTKVVLLIVTLMVFKLYVQGTKPVYKTWLIDVLETACLINILTFSFFKLYYLAENISQVIIAYISGTIIIIKFASVLIYHICTDILTKTKVWKAIKNCREKKMRENNGKDELTDVLASTSDDENEMPEPTITIIEPPAPQEPLSNIAEGKK